MDERRREIKSVFKLMLAIIIYYLLVQKAILKAKAHERMIFGVAKIGHLLDCMFNLGILAALVNTE